MVGIAVIIVLVIVVGVVGAFVLSDQGILDLNLDFQLGQFTGGFIETMVGQIEETPVLLGTQNFDGDLNVTFFAESVLETQFQKTLSGIFQYDTICYERIGDDILEWEILGVGGNANVNEQQTIKIRKTTENDAGLTEMWCRITSQTGANFFLVDIDGIIKANTRIDTCIFEDPDFNNVDDWVCRVNLLDVSMSNPKIPPILDVRLKFFRESPVSPVPDLVCTTCPTFINQESNHDNFPSIDNFLKFDSDFVPAVGVSLTRGHAKALSQIQITTQGACMDQGCTAFTGSELEENYDINNSFIEVPFGDGTQKIKLSDMSSAIFDTKIIYKWMYDDATGRRDVAGANVIILEAQEDPIIDFPVIMQTTFARGSQNQGLCVQLELEYVNGDGTTNTTEETIEIVAQSSNDVQCVIGQTD